MRLRHATRDDADTVVEIARALDEALLGWSDYTRADLDEDWRTFEVEENVWLVIDDDTPVGFGQIDLRGEPARSDGYVHPAHFGRGIGALLVDELEREIAAHGRDRVHNATLAVDTRAHDLLRSRGYDEVRRFLQMRIELDVKPLAPRWPKGVSVSPLDAPDGPEFHAAYEDAFADHWNHRRRPFEEWRSDHMEGDDFAPELWAVVREGRRIVAGSILIRERNGAAWVSRLFTARDRRRRGLGEALLHDAFGKFWREDRRVVGLGVDARSNTGANRLYERAGMHVHLGAAVFEKLLSSTE